MKRSLVWCETKNKVGCCLLSYSMCEMKTNLVLGNREA